MLSTILKALLAPTPKYVVFVDLSDILYLSNMLIKPKFDMNIPTNIGRDSIVI